MLKSTDVIAPPNSAPQYSEVSRMIADVGGMRNVSGSRMATPLAPPSPGSTPMMVPSVIPTTATSRLNGVIAMWKPRAMFSKPISVTQPGFERSLRQGDQEPALEDDERRHRERQRETEGAITVSTERSCSRVTKGLSECLRSARMTTATPCPIRMTASQKGKNPLCGPSGPQRKPSRMASTSTIAPSKVSSDAVMMSAVRIRLLGEQAALRHQVLVQLFVLLHPLGVLGAGGEGRLERSVLQVLPELGRLVDLLEEARVPLHRVFRHVRGSEDAAQHLVFDVHPERLLHRRNLLPGRIGDPIGVEYRERADALGLPVADALDRVVHGGVDVLADQVDAHLAPALERNVSELDAQRVLELHGDDLVLLLREIGR